jgi:hypothetical protein
MHRFTLLTVFAAIALAQSDNPFNRPPAGVDQALRARMKEFYDFHIKAEHRKAEALVAEDTKDYFYSHNKPKYLSCEIKKIDYSDKFTKAVALVSCEQYVMMPGFSGKMAVPEPSNWKVEDGKWFWYVDPANIGKSPFGPMKPGPDTPVAPLVNGAPISLGNVPNTTDFLFTQVKVDKKEVSLKPGESATVTISNGAPGAMTLTIPSQLTGIEATLDKTTMQSGEKATLTVKAGENAKAGVLNLQVEPIGQILPVQIVVK